MNAGYREIEHTADWALEIWAPDMAALLQQAARGMYALLGIHLAPDERVEKRLHLSAPDEETL
ncbi:MAG: archease, partial [Anaerolineae bacterium]